jgi:membrane protease YdiL (CAAX protease family)
VDADDPRSGASGTPNGSPLAASPLVQATETLSARVGIRRWSFVGFVATALAAFAAATAVSFGMALALGIVTKPPQARTPHEILAVTLVADAALVIVLFALARWLMRVGLRELGFRAPTRAALRFAVAAAPLLWIGSILVNIVQIRLLGPRPQSLVVSFGAHEGLEAFVLDVITGGVIAPLAEEPLFRGLVLGGLAQRAPFAAAAVVSSLLFALTHGVGVLAPIFALGLGLAYLYRRTGTLWAPILAHALVNAISLVLLFSLPRPA